MFPRGPDFHGGVARVLRSRRRIGNETSESDRRDTGTGSVANPPGGRTRRNFDQGTVPGPFPARPGFAPSRDWPLKTIPERRGRDFSPHGPRRRRPRGATSHSPHPGSTASPVVPLVEDTSGAFPDRLARRVCADCRRISPDRPVSDIRFSLGLSHGDFRSEGSRVCVARHGFGECPIALLTPRIRGGLTYRTSWPLHRAPDASHVRPSRVSGGARHSSFRSLRLPGAPPRLATALVSRAPLPCLFLRLWRFRRTTGSCRVSPANAARTATRRRRRCGATDRTGPRRSATRAECAITGGTPRCAPPSRNPGKSLMTLEAPA